MRFLFNVSVFTLFVSFLVCLIVPDIEFWGMYLSIYLIFIICWGLCMIVAILREHKDREKTRVEVKHLEWELALMEERIRMQKEGALAQTPTNPVLIEDYGVEPQIHPETM